MPAPTAQNPTTSTSESKSAKKKKASAARTSEGNNGSPARVATPDQGTLAAANDANESPYIRELKKTIRNTSKKILNASKTEAIIRENSDKSTDQLLAAKIINADQKRQVENKPALEAELARTEEQLAQVLKLDDEWRNTLATAKADTEKKLAEKYEQEKADAVAEVKSKAEADQQKVLEDAFLIVSQFLSLVARRRTVAENSTEDPDLAIEGVLLKVYAGDHTAVAAMSKLYHGSEDTTTSIDGTPLKTTFGQIRQLAAAQATGPVDESEDAAPEEPATDTIPTDSAPAESATPVQTDPTIAHAGLTEIDAGTDVALANVETNGDAAGAEAPIPNAETGENAANAAAESQWDTSNDLAASQEWVEVQKPVEAPQTQAQPSAPAAAAPAASWADEEPSATRNPVDANDGFQSVQRNRGRGNGDGFRGGRGGQGRGGRGGNSWRGDGQRGRGRGGRGGPRFADNGGARREGGGGRVAE